MCCSHRSIYFISALYHFIYCINNRVWQQPTVLREKKKYLRTSLYVRKEKRVHITSCKNIEKKINNNPSSQFADNSIEIYNLVTTLETRITKEEKDKTNKRIAIIIRE